MPTLFSLNDGNLTDSNVFGQTLSSADLFNGTSNINVGTSYSNASVNAYSITSDGSTLSAVTINVNFRAANPTGTLSMMLSSGASYVTETYAISSFTPYDDRNNLISDVSQNWQILKLTTPFTSTSGSKIRLDFLTSDPNQLALVGTITAFEDSKDVIGTFNGTLTQTDSPFLSSPQEISYLFNSSNSNILDFEGYNDTVFGTGDFTVELWFKLNSTATYHPLIMKGIGYNGGNPAWTHDWFLFLYNNNTIWFSRYTDVDAPISFSYTLTVGVWTHIAICRKNRILTPYINGVSLPSQTNNVNYFNNTNLGIRMGASVMENAWQYLDGSVTNARVIAGKAVYTKNFTVPSSPLALDSGFTTANYKSPTSPTYVSEITPFSGVDAEDGSLSFNGTSDYLTVPASTNFNFASGIFTVEAWVRFSNINQQGHIASNYNNTTSGWSLQLYLSKLIFCAAGNPIHIQGTTTVQADTWYHIVVAGSPGSYKMFLNGVQEGVTYTGATSLAGAGLNIGCIGSGISPQYFHTGHISNLRILNGTALYTSNFAVPTAPLSNIANTSLLLKAPYSPLSRNVDYSLTPFTGGNAEPSSLYFNGADYLTLPASPNFNFASGTFTVEAWVRFDDLNNHIIASNWLNTGTGWTFQYYGNQLMFNGAGNPAHIVSNTTTIQANTWYHVAVAGSTGSYKMFINGVQVGNTYTGGTSFAGTTLYIGVFNNLTAYNKGYISNLRIVNGTALYTSNFAVPTAPLTNITNTVYLLQSPYEQFGMLSNQSPFGVGTDSSIRITNNNYVSSPAVQGLALGTNDFTIECWVNAVYGDAYNHLFSLGFYNAGGILVRRVTNGTADNLYFAGSNYSWSTNTFLTPNVWQHFALVRSNNVLSVYVDGVSRFSVNVAGKDMGAAKQLFIGAYSGDPSIHGLNGNISNFRVVNGTALYTSNFTPSTSPLSAVAGTVFLMKDAYDTRFTTPYSTPFLLGSYGNVNKGLITTTTKDPTTFVDYGTLTKNNITLSAASPFGAGIDGSIRFAGTAGSHINLPDNSDTTFQTGDFTIEMWVNFNSIGTTTQSLMQGSWGPITQLAIWQHTGYPNKISVWSWGGFSSNVGFLVSTTELNINRWYHIAVTRSGNTFRLFVDGNLESTHIGAMNITAPMIYIGTYDTANLPFRGCMSNIRLVKGTALYAENFTRPSAPFAAIPTTSLLYKSAYSNNYERGVTIDLHVGGALKGLTSESRNLTASSMYCSDIYVHNQGKLTFPTDSSRTLYALGSKGLQITSDGTLEIGTANNPISSAVQHSIVLNNSQIDVHNGGNMNVYGAYKKPYTYLTADSVSAARTFTVVDAVSANWSVGDSVVFTPNTFQANSFDVLTLSSFDGGSTFRTTASAAFNHPSVTSLGNVPTVSNLSRNVSICGNSSLGRATVRAIDAAKVNIANTQFINFGIASANKTGFVVGVNPSGYLTLSGNSFNSDGFVGTTHTTTVSSRPILGNVTIRDNVFFRSGGNGVSLSSVSATALTVTGNTLLSSASSGLFFASVSSSGITMSNNTVIGARSNGTLIANSNINGDITGVVNYRNGNSGLVLSATQCGNLTNIVSIHNIGEGIYIDGSVPNLLSNTTFSNITASNNATLGFRLSGNTINHLAPVTLNINRLIANNNLSGGFEGYCISGNLSSLQLNNNGIYGMRTSIGNADTTIDGITAFMNNVASTSAGIGILSGTNYYPILIKDAIVGGLSGSGISLDSTKFSQFNVINSTVSGRSSFNVTASRSIVEGSYLISNTNVSNLPVGTGITNSNYQPEVFKTTGFAFTNMNNASGYNVTYLAAGNRAVDSTLTGNISAVNAPSERLTPQSTTLKLRSGSKFVALSAGQSTRISVYMRKSSVANNGVAYNGTSPRLILKRNATMGIASDIVVDQLDTTSEIFLKLSGVSPTVTDTGVLEFYVDCDGTTGWINIDNWSAT